MKSDKWFWNSIVLLIGVLISMLFLLFIRDGYSYLFSSDSSEIVLQKNDVAYSVLPIISEKLLDDGSVLVFASVEDISFLLSSQKIAIRVLDEFGLDLNISSSSLEDVPYVQFLASQDEVFHIEYSFYDGSEKHFLRNIVLDLSDSSMISPQKPLKIPSPELRSAFDVLSLEWLGSADTILSDNYTKVYDVSPVSRRFRTSIRIFAPYDEEVQLFAVFMDDGIRFKYSLPPREESEMLLSVDDLPYGSHRLLIYALYPSGERSADIVFSFEYLPPKTFFSITKFLLDSIYGVKNIIFK